MAIRSPAIATANWVSRTGAASGFWRSQSDAATWKAQASSAQSETNYATAMQTAISKKSRLNAILASSDATWHAGIDVVGEARYQGGVTAGANRMAAAMGKLIPAMVTIIASLPAAGPRGSAANITRATQFMQELAAQRGAFRASGVPRA